MAQLKRTYEVSVWTLQDEFISILKGSNIENKGMIENPDFHIIDDGTEEYSFSIPMYLYDGLKRIANPLWENTQNGVIIQDMRKIKLTFNKNTEVEKTFEFIIVEVEERHDKDQLYCDVKCSGLAFHELGKTGYKITLSADDFNDDDYKYFIGETNVQPKANLQYWMNKIMPYLPSGGKIDSSQWYYKIEMDQHFYGTGRDSNKIYEDAYVKSWELNNNEYIPKELEEEREKERMVDISESNIYNITQDLAKTFGVFCRYEYKHNSNLNIIQRTVIFYNSYMREKEGYIDLTYPYSTSSITRNRDSNELSTKMYIKSVDDETSATGQITIMDVAANKMREDYLLNFDYLYKIGNITKEQYSEIKKFEANIGECNKVLKSIEQPLLVNQNKLIEVKSEVTFYTNAIQLDKERLSAAGDLLNQLTNNEGVLHITASNPRSAVLVKVTTSNTEEKYHAKLTEKGIIQSTLKVYQRYNFTARKLENELQNFLCEKDEFNNLSGLSFITEIKTNDNKEETENNQSEDEKYSSVIYLTYDYSPQLYYDNVISTWTSRLSKDENELIKANERLENINSTISSLTDLYQEQLIIKQKYVKNFEKLMGPALRESYWTPEEYKDDGNNFLDEFSMTTKNTFSAYGKSGFTKIFWDTQAFEDELEKTSYNTGINLSSCAYPVIDLSEHLEYIKNNYNKISFMFYDFSNLTEETKTIKNMRIFSVGATAQYGFVYSGSSIKPVLIITGFEALSDDSRKRLANPDFCPTIGVITTTVTDKEVRLNIEQGSWTPTFLNTVSKKAGVFKEMQLYYPRIEINSLKLKIDDILFGLKYNDILLKNYEDYYILMRDNSKWNNNTLVEGDSAYYVTIKPEVFLSQGAITQKFQIKFNISNADISIYLDALKILKENSQPKVSYTIEPSIINGSLLYTLYNQLCRICNINDNELKFENVQGYISEITIKCDSPKDDKIEIKNYKSKFEDIFSTIVAQTEAMKNNQETINSISGVITAHGFLNEEAVQNVIDNNNLSFSFNKNKLTITENEGIVGISKDGAVQFRDTGIFTATEKDKKGNWKWNTAILPSGINASLIKGGQLDINDIKIQAGDKIRFQLNKDGIFAYKSFFEDLKTLDDEGKSQVANSTARVNDIDSAQYVTMNENGLFLWGKKNALVLTKEKNKYTKLNKDIARVEISWDGLKLRNWGGDEVFFADPDTGNLTVKGAIYASALNINKDVDICLSGNGAIKLLRDNGEGIIIDNNGILMETSGKVVLKGSEGSITFEKMINNETKTIFMINEDGDLWCRNILCTGNIEGNIQQDENTEDNPPTGDEQQQEWHPTEKRILKYMLPDTQSIKSESGSWSRTTTLSCSEPIYPGTYKFQLEMYMGIVGSRNVIYKDGFSGKMVIQIGDNTSDTMQLSFSNNYNQIIVHRTIEAKNSIDNIVDKQSEPVTWWESKITYSSGDNVITIPAKCNSIDIKTSISCTVRSVTGKNADMFPYTGWILDQEKNKIIKMTLIPQNS